MAVVVYIIRLDGDIRQTNYVAAKFNCNSTSSLYLALIQRKFILNQSHLKINQNHFKFGFILSLFKFLPT